MAETIRIELSDWQFNAGLVGLYNVLAHAQETVITKKQFIEFDIDALENFAEKYLRYFIDLYNETTPWYRIVSYEATLSSHEVDDFSKFDQESLEHLNNYIKQVKDYLTRSNYQKIFSYIHSEYDIESLVNELNVIKVRKNAPISDYLDEVKEQFSTIRKIIEYCSSSDGMKYIAAKGVIYSVINNGWNNVSFLNRQTKEFDVYVDYHNHFVAPTIEYIKSDKTKFKYQCFNCGNKISRMSNDIAFLNQTGFDSSRKTSHVWNFANDVVICDLCKLVYSCLPAGFVYAYNYGIFVNSNASADDLIRVNRKFRDDVLKTDNQKRSFTYRALVNAITEKERAKVQYELQDVQVIRYENEKYRFNILSKDILRVIRDSKKELDTLLNAGYREVRTYFSVYDLVMDNLLNNYNLFTLIHKLLVYSITKSQSIETYYHMGHVMSLNLINVNYLKGVDGVDKGNVNEHRDLVQKARAYGYYLRQDYLEKDRDADKNKIRGISYRLLNALKTRNSEMFMHNIITSYMFVGKPIPSKLTLALEDDEMLGIVGYAFVTGLNGGEHSAHLNGGDNNES